MIYTFTNATATVWPEGFAWAQPYARGTPWPKTPMNERVVRLHGVVRQQQTNTAQVWGMKWVPNGE